MPKHLPCPKCATPLTLSGAATRIQCGRCGASIRVAGKAPVASPAPDEPPAEVETAEPAPLVARPRSKKRKKPTRGADPARRRAVLIAAALGAAGLAVLGLGLVAWLLVGGRGGGPSGGSDPDARFAVAASSGRPKDPASDLAAEWAKQGQPLAAPPAAEPAATDPPPDLGGDGPPLPVGPPPAVERRADFVVPDLETNAVPVSPDGRLALVVPAGGKQLGYNPAVVVDLSTGREVTRYSHGLKPDRVYTKLSPDGRWVAQYVRDNDAPDAAGRNKPVTVWQPGSERRTTDLKVAGRFRWAEFVAPARLAVLVEEPDPALEVWDVAALKRVLRVPAPGHQRAADDGMSEFRGGQEPVGAAVSPDGRFVAAGAADRVTVFDLQAGAVHGHYPAPASRGFGSYYGCGFLPDPARLAVVIRRPKGDNPVAVVWDLATGKRTDAADLPRRDTLRPGRLTAGPAGRLVLGDFDPVLIDADAGWYRPLVAGAKELAASPPAGGVRLASVTLPNAAVRRGGEKPPPLPDYVQSKLTPTNDVRMVLFTRPDPAPTFRPAEAAAKPSAPPAAYAPPPAADWPGPAPLPDPTAPWPDVLSDRLTVRFRADDTLTPPAVRRVVAERFDRAAGKPLPPLTVCESAFDPAAEPPQISYWKDYPFVIAAALDPAGRLAFVSPANPRRVDVWDAAGKPAGGLTVRRPVRWVGFAADGRLLTVSGGDVAAWDLATGAAAWAVAGDYTGGADLARGGRWGAFHAGPHLDLLDTATGACLGRLDRAGGPARPYEVALAPDGRRLLAVLARPGADPAKAGKGNFTLRLWDLATRGVLDLPDPPLTRAGADTRGCVGWAAPDALVMHYARTAVVSVHDLRAGGAVVAVPQVFAKTSPPEPGRFFAGGRAEEQGSGVRLARDGRIAAVIDPDLGQEAGGGRGKGGPGVWYAVGLPALTPLADPARKYLRLAGQTVRAEADLGDPALSGQAAQTFADSLAGAGCAVGEGGWTVQVSFRLSDSNPETLTTPGVPVSVQGGVLRRRLLAPGQTEPVWQEEGKVSLLAAAGHHFRASEEAGEKAFGGRDRRLAYYNFRGQDPTAALAAAYRADLAANTQALAGLPGWLLEAGGRHRPLPLTDPATLSPAAD